MKGRVKEGVKSEPFNLYGHMYQVNMGGFTGEITDYGETIWMDFDEDTKERLRNPEFGRYINSCIQERESFDCYVYDSKDVEII